MLIDNALHRKSVNILRICKSTFRRSHTSIYHTFVSCNKFVLQLSLSNCNTWLQIQPNLDASLTLDAGESESGPMLEIRRDSFSFVVKLDLQIAEVLCNFIAKTA